MFSLLKKKISDHPVLQGYYVWASYIKVRSNSLENAVTYRLCGLNGHKLVVAFLSADVAEGPVVPGVLGDVADLVDRVVMKQDLHLEENIVTTTTTTTILRHNLQRFRGGGGLPALYNRAAPQCTLCWL